MRRNRRAKIVATLGPASSDAAVIRRLFEAGVDVFRLNFSHGTKDDHADQQTGRPGTPERLAESLHSQLPMIRYGAQRHG